MLGEQYRVGDKVFDGSIRSRLADLKDAGITINKRESKNTAFRFF